MSARVLACVLTPLLLLGAAGSAHADLDRARKRELQQTIAEAADSGRWERAAEAMQELAEANDADTLRFLVRVAEASDGNAEVMQALRFATSTMDGRGVDREATRALRSADNPAVRRALLLALAGQEKWDALIDCLDDRDESVAALAVWRLVEAQVEEAVEPMIARMERLDRDQGHIWDVLRNGLGELLGQRLNSGVEYRSVWTIVQENGGLSSVRPQERPTTGGNVRGGELQSGVRLFGREIECTRVVFILDTSGSMEAVDPNQTDYDDGPTRTHGGGDSQSPQPGQLNRLQRAQRALKQVIRGLPESYEINIVAYSSQVRIWRGPSERSTGGYGAPGLHPLTQSNRDDACNWVDEQVARGVTVTDTAIERSFDVEGARCFYLLSDGAATHDGRNFLSAADMIAAIDECATEDRRVKIHTMGFPQADEAMMRRVAEHTGGEYSDIR
jgi:von Willebrand factor type A domain